MKDTKQTEQTRIEELDAMIARIMAIQTERSLGDSSLIAEYPDLGSAKTWRDRLIPRAWDQINLHRWHAKLTRVCTVIDGGSPDDDFYPDLPFAREMAAQVMALERQTNDRRVAIILAPTGTGKSFTARWQVSQRRSVRAIVRIRPSWRNKAGHINAGIIRALGEEPQSTTPAFLEDAAIRLLRQQPRTLFLDQAHEGGVALMHLIRAYVDETPSRFVYLAYNTAYRAVMSGTRDAMIEAHAFLGRCRKPIFDLYTAGTRQPDAAFYLRQTAGLSETAADSLAVEILPALNRLHNLRLLDDAIERAEADDKPGLSMQEKIKHHVLVLSGLAPQQTRTAKEAA